MSHYSADENILCQNQEADLVGLVSDVITALGEPFRGCPWLYRDLKRSVAIMAAEIQSRDILLALSELRTLRWSFAKMAKAFNEAFRNEFVKSKYQQLEAEEQIKQTRRFNLFPSWLISSTDLTKAHTKKWTQTHYSCLGMLRELLQSPLRRELRIAELLSDDPRVIKDLTSLVMDFNDLVEQLESGQSLEDEDLAERGLPKPLISEAAIRGESSIRQLSQALYHTLHDNWPCRSEGHEHGGKLGNCVEAKFCLDPRWSSRDPDPLRDSFFILLAGSDIIQECRIGLHPISVTNETNTLACLVDYEDSMSVCLQLTKDGKNRLWDQKLGRPLEILQLEEEYVERSLESLRKLLEIVKPTYAAKRVLGVILARSLLHLLEGPWTSLSLSIDDISLFCKVQNGRPCPLFDKVFLSTVFKVNDSENDPQEGRRSPYNVHPFPTILALGILLAEIELGDELPEIYSQPSFSELRSKPFALAKKLWKECERRFHLQTGLMRAVNFCVDRTSFLRFANLSSESVFADPGFVNTYYMNAVRPLEEDLVNGAKWTWDEVNWLQRRNLDDQGVCKVISKLEKDLNLIESRSQPDKMLRKWSKPSGSASTLQSIPETKQKIPSSAILRTSHKAYNDQTFDSCEPLRPKTRDDFEIAIICALPLEANAVLSVFDYLWDEDSYAYGKAANDPNFYSVGVMRGRNVVLAHPPHPGKATAANVAAACAMSFKNVKLALVVGVCGGVPFKHNKEEILLGDVIISKGVIQYDHGRQFSDQFRRKIDVEASLGRPNARIGSFLAALETSFYRASLQHKITAFLTNLGEDATSYPGKDEDKLFLSSYPHKHHDSRRCQVCASCEEDDDPVCVDTSDLSCQETGCEITQLVQRHRENQKHQPMVHIGLIASGDSVVKSSAHRDRLAEKENVIAFEMEGAGVWDALPCVIVKGVCDYADSHKNKLWQEYAATTAAACTKAVIQYW